MSGLRVRVGAAVIATMTLFACFAAGATPVVPVEDVFSSADLSPVQPMPAPTVGDALPAPMANQTTTAIPVPPGVVFGLVGLASAAIARRRYLKRH